MVNTSVSASTFTTTTEEIAEFAGRTLKMGNYVKRSIEQMTTITANKPTVPPQDKGGKVDEVDQAIYREEVKSYVSERKLYESSMQKTYSIIYGQCSDGVRAKMEGMDNHISLSNAGDPIGLLRNVKTVMSNFQTTKYMPHAIYDCKRSLFLCRQDRDTTVPQYYKEFKSIVDVIEYNGGSLGADEGLVRAKLASSGCNPDSPTRRQKDDATSQARDATVACIFILGADKWRFGKLKEDLENAYTQGDDKYPVDLTEAYKLLTNWKQETRTMAQVARRIADIPEVAFTNVTDDTEGSTAQMTFANVARGTTVDQSLIQCYHCQQLGHYANDCTNPRVERAGRSAGNGGSAPRSDVQLLMDAVIEDDHGDFSFHTTGHARAKLPESWILLDNQSTVNIFYNGKLLQNIRPMDTYVNVQCNAGTTRTNLMGTLKGFGDVWYHPNGIANILSMALVEELYPVTYTKERGFVVHKTNGTTRRFVKSDRGLYYMDTDHKEGDTERAQECEVALIHTVSDKRSSYTAKAYKAAKLARKIQCMIGRPSLQDFLKIVDNNHLVNCPVTRRDVMAAEDILGPDVGSIRGKTVRTSSPQVEHRRTSLPPEIHARYQSVTLGVDIMFINKIAFFVTISNDLKFGTVEHIVSRHHDVVYKCIQRICNVYKLGGFQVTQINSDKEFGSLQVPLAGLTIGLNVASDDEHVGTIERYIRTVKERTRSVWNTLPFKQLPSRMIIELVRNSVSWLNMFPVNDGVSPTLGPRAIVTGVQADYQHHCKIEFGSYVQTHEQHDNSMKTRTIGAIALRPNGNSQGGYYFLSLTTGRRIDRRSWTELPMPNDIIDRVHVLARRDKSAPGLAFGWRDGTAITDNDDGDDPMADPDYDPDDDGGESDSDTSYYDDDDGNPDEAPIAGVLDHGNHEENIEHEEEGDDAPPQVGDSNEDEHGSVEGVGNHDDGNAAEQRTVHFAETVTEDDTAEGVHDHGGNTTTDAIERPHGLRPRKPRNYDTHLGIDKPVEHGMLHANLRDLEHTVLTQYSAKKGLKVFGEAGADAIISEMKQLDTMDVIEPKAASMLTRAEKKAALEYLMFLKQKRCGRIKGRGCADGRKQRLYMDKEDTSSPTVTTEGLFLSCTIDAKEGRDVATADIPGAFMQTDMDTTVHVRLSGPLATLLTRVDPKKYKKFLTDEGGKPVMYVRLKKALYGTL
jgi:hypothetical protein